jgi:hypothetical protein
LEGYEAKYGGTLWFFIVVPLLGYGEKINSSAQNLIFWNVSEESLVMVTMVLVFFSHSQLALLGIRSPNTASCSFVIDCVLKTVCVYIRCKFKKELKGRTLE